MYIILSKQISDNKYLRSVFDLNTGICLYEVIDTIIDKDNFIRNNNKLSLTIQEDKLINLQRDIQFEYLKYKYKEVNLKKESYKGMSNPNFGTLDLETYEDIESNLKSKSKSKVYAIGYVTLRERDKINTFYLSDIPSLDSNLLVILCIDSMLIPKYHNYIFYVHNLGKFDVVFLHKILREFNLQSNKEHYILKSVFRDGIMLKLSISIKLSAKKYIKINFVDSINYFNVSMNSKTDSYSLYSLCKSLKVNTIKGIFPHKFVTKETLNYVGETPSIIYYNNKITKQEYEISYLKSN